MYMNIHTYIYTHQYKNLMWAIKIPIGENWSEAICPRSHTSNSKICI